MGTKRSFAERLAEIGREYEARMTAAERVQERLRWEDWERLRRETTDFARRELWRRRWRGAVGGLLPGGYDAEALASEAAAQLLGGRCRLPLGFLRIGVRRELERLVSDKIRLLHRLKEAAGTRSEWDVAPTGGSGEPVSVFERMSDGGQAVSQWEGRWERRCLKEEIEMCLEGEPQLLGLFRFLWSGETRPGTIARGLGVEERAVAAGRRRLERRLVGRLSLHGVFNPSRVASVLETLRQVGSQPQVGVHLAQQQRPRIA
jgi:hypothetical protein